MKLGASYSVFDGVELLRASITQVRDVIDHINVQYQDLSWFYDKVKKEDVAELQALKSEGLIDSLTLFTGFRPISRAVQHNMLQAKVLETRKRNDGLNVCRAKSCTHFINLDVDEFYNADQFAKAKAFIDTYACDTTAIHYINYVTPTLHRGVSPHLVPFIHRIAPDSIHSKSQPYFNGTDPTRTVISDSYKKWVVLDEDFIMMHHMEMVRKDLKLKYDATSRFYLDRNRIPQLISQIKKSQTEKEISFNGIIFPGMKHPIPLFEVENKFNIHI